MADKGSNYRIPRPRKKRYPSHVHQAPPGSSPGLLTPNPQHHPTELSILGYGPDGCQEEKLTGTDGIWKYLEQWPVVWVNVIGLRDISLIEQIGTMFGLHRLVLEDILNTQHRPKIDDYDNYQFLIVKKGAYSEQFETEQVSIILKDKVVITFQEKPGNSFELVCERIRRGTGKIRHSGPDYLNYAILDTIVDGYYPILEAINHRLEIIENEIISASSTATIDKIHHAKSDLLFLHRAIWPMRDIINMLSRADNPFNTQTIQHYLRDCYDQCVQVTELTEFYRDVASGLMNTFLAYSGHKMNEIMKVLTMISAIFIPLSFIAGIYGMNFNTHISPYNMPELNWIFGYPLALSLMLLIALGMLYSFRRRGWLGKLPKYPRN